MWLPSCVCLTAKGRTLGDFGLILVRSPGTAVSKYSTFRNRTSMFIILQHLAAESKNPIYTIVKARKSFTIVSYSYIIQGGTCIHEINRRGLLCPQKQFYLSVVPWMKGLLHHVVHTPEVSCAPLASRGSSETCRDCTCPPFKGIKMSFPVLQKKPPKKQKQHFNLNDNFEANRGHGRTCVASESYMCSLSSPHKAQR